jgi:agmatine deiminase
MTTVYVSRKLQKYFPNVHDQIGAALTANGLQLEFGGDDDNFWCRDYLPVPTKSGLCKFTYKYPPLRLHLGEKLEYKFYNQIILDGGNVVQDDDRVIMTDIVFRQNIGSRTQITEALEGIFQKPIIFIPVEPGDDLGHSDGIVHLIGGGRVLVNDYSRMPGKQWKRYQKELYDTLHDAGLSAIGFVNAYHQWEPITESEFRVRYPFGDSFNPAPGYFINFLRVGGVILMPQFGYPEDSMAMKGIKLCFPDHKVYPIECLDLSILGGLVHCVTWTKE